MLRSDHDVPMLVQAHLLSGALVTSPGSTAETSRARTGPLSLLLAVNLMAAALLATPALGSDRPGIVEGVVTDAGAESPLPGANVAVRHLPDSTLVNGTTTDSTGHFVVDDLPTGKYAVVVSFMGYESVSRDIRLTASDPDRTLDPVRLGEATARMDGASVSAQRPAITMEGSKKVYDFEKAQVALSSKSVVDVLRDLPSVRIDFEGNIHLRGSSAVKIHVNGEPLAMDGRSLVQYLKSMSGNDVKRVEINTNPSARHDAEGTANIINLVLDEQDGPGWSGGFSASAGSRPGADGSANLGYGSDSWSLYGSYSYRHSQNETAEHLRRRDLDDARDILLEQSSSREYKYGGHSFNAQIEYTPTQKTTVSLTSTGNIHESNASRRMSSERSSWESSRRRDVTRTHDHAKLDERLSVTQTFDQKKHELSADLRYQFGDETDEVREERTFDSNPRTLERNPSTRHDASVKVDYTKPVGPWTLETGYKGTARWLDQDYSVARVADAETPPSSTAPLQSDGLNYQERVHAGYGIVQRTVGPVDVEAGLRYEHTATTVDEDGAPADENQYGNFFPSASLNYDLGSGSRVSLSYTNRVDRPGTFQLSAFSASDDQYVKFVGNPNLDPEQIHQGELSFMQNLGLGTVTVAPYLRRTTNAIEWKTTRNDSITVRTFENYDSKTSYGAEVTSSLQFGENLKANVSGNVFRRLTRGGGLAQGDPRTSIAWMGQANVTWTPRSDLRLQWSQMYRSPRTSGLGRTDALTRSSVSIEKTFWDEHGSLGVRFEDPFNTSEYGYQKRTDTFRERLTRNWQGRALSISFSYQFGDGNKKRRANKAGGGGMAMGGG